MGEESMGIADPAATLTPAHEQFERGHEDGYSDAVELEESHRRLCVGHYDDGGVRRELRVLVTAAAGIAWVVLLNRRHAEPRVRLRGALEVDEQLTAERVVRAREEHRLASDGHVASRDVVGEGRQVERPHARKVLDVRLVVTVVGGDDCTRRGGEGDDCLQPRLPPLGILTSELEVGSDDE